MSESAQKYQNNYQQYQELNGKQKQQNKKTKTEEEYKQDFIRKQNKRRKI